MMKYIALTSVWTVLLYSIEGAQAQTTTIEFTGRVTSVAGVPFGVSAAVGDPVSASLSYDLSVADTVGSATFGKYPQVLSNGFQINVGGAVIGTSSYNVFVFTTANDVEGIVATPRNDFHVNGDLVMPTADGQTRIGLTLYNDNGDGISSDSLPLTLDIADLLGQNNFIQQSPLHFGLPGYQFIQFRLDSAVVITSNAPPVADAGQDNAVECWAPLTSVQLDGSGSIDPDGDDLEFEWSIPDGSGATLDDPSSATPMGQFPLGPTLVTLTVTDGKGGISIDDVLVTVRDTTPPVLVCTTDPIALWAPRHDMRRVEICIAVSDNCAFPEELLLNARVSSSEPDDATGDGATAGDVDGFDGFTHPVSVAGLEYDADAGCYLGVVWLRAERNGAGSGRVYSIVCDVLDVEGNFATASCVVVVPHDKRKK